LPELLGGEAATRSGERMENRANHGGGTAGLVEEWVSGFVQQDLVPRPAVHGEGDLIAHRARGEEERRLLSQEVGHHLLQLVDGRILPLLFVPHLRLAHRPAHGCGRAGDRVGVEIDQDGHKGSEK
jgi:hypothetical protein